MFFKKPKFTPDTIVAEEYTKLKDKVASQITQATIYAEFHEEDHITTGEFPLNANEWVQYSEFNVQAILCSLNNTYNNLTIINCRFEEGGFIPPLKHDRWKTIYVIDGEFTDTVNNKTFKKGDVYKLNPHTLHSIKSDDCLVTITWEPAY